MSNEELSDFMKHVPDKVAPRTVAVWCGDCGSWPSEDPKTCPKCGGPADSLLGVEGLRKLATARLTALFEARDEVAVHIAGRIRGFGIAGVGEYSVPAPYLEDVAGDFNVWPAAEQAAYYIAIAFGQEYERRCKKCDGLKPDCICEEK